MKVNGEEGCETYDDDGRHHGQGCDAEFLYVFQHLDEIELRHDVNGNTTPQSTSDEDSLRHRVVEREEAKPFPGPC
jgi:hypothetical protein